MTTLTEFLLARIAEDEEKVRLAYPSETPGLSWIKLGSAHDDNEIMPACEFLAIDPARVLRECEAKRRIVEHAAYADEEGGGYADCMFGLVLPALAAIYADHPDFDPAWSLGRGSAGEGE